MKVPERDHQQRFEELLALGLDRPELQGGVQLHVYLAEPGEQTLPHDRAPLNGATGYTFSYTETTDPARAFVFVENNTDDDLYIAVLDLSERQDCIILSPATFVRSHETKNVNNYGLCISFSFPDGIEEAPGARTLGWLKIVASSHMFDAAAFRFGAPHEPPPHPFPSANRLESLAARITTESSNESLTDDWGDGPVWWSRNVATNVEIPKPAPVSEVLELIAMQAGPGDCLVVSYPSGSSTHRILVDGGLGSSYDAGLGDYLSSLGPRPEFDIVVVTHIDRDHIEGVLRAVGDDRLHTADFWFNGRATIGALVKPKRSVAQGDELSRLIPNKLRNRFFDGRAIHVPAGGPTTEIVPQLGGAKCTILSPTQIRLERLFDKWPRSIRSENPLDALFEAVDEAAPVVRGPGEFGKDSSRANGSSIAFLLEVGAVSLLLTGDCFADDLETAIRDYLKEGSDRLKVDLFKLSHHGSRNNLTDSLLSLIAPRMVLVCTDGSGHKHPDPDALDKLRDHYGDIPIHFTANNELIRQRARRVGASPPAQLPLRLTFELE